MRRCLAVVSVVVWMLACGGDNPATGPTSTPSPPAVVTQASPTLTIAPNPIIAGASSDPRFRYSAHWTVTFREGAGLGYNVDFINSTLRSVTTGMEVGTLNFGAGRVVQSAGTNHVDARGSLSVPMGINYTLAFGSRQAIVTIAAQVTDERGNRFNLSDQVGITLRAR